MSATFTLSVMRKGVADMTTYTVHLNSMMSQVIISLEGYEPTKGEGFKELGKFDLDIDPNDAQLLHTQGDVNKGDHPFIVEARKVLQEYLGEHNSTKGYTFLDRATNAVTHDNDVDMSTDAMDMTEGTQSHPDASTQPGGVQNSQTGEHRPEQQVDGQKPETPPATEHADGKETVAALKERLGSITDKAELEKIYTDEQNGQNRPTAIAAIEARAKELSAE